MIARDEVRQALTGPIFSLNTPFTAEGEIDERGIRRLIDFALAHGAKAIILTNGDSLYTILSDEEVARVTRLAAEHTAGRAMVVAAEAGFRVGRWMRRNADDPTRS